MIVTPEPWMADAECRGSRVDAWFPERGVRIQPLKDICAVCPVSGECLNYALEHRIVHGIWGGMSERQRRRIRSEQNRERAA